MLTVTQIELKKLLSAWADTMCAHKDQLTQLDSIVGDADLGLTMSDGFSAAAQAAANSQEQDLGKLLYLAGKTMSSAVPSTMGTLMASGLMSAGRSLNGKKETNIAGVAQMMQSFCDGIIKIGKAQVGEKTIVDALSPGAKAMLEAVQAGAEASAVLQAGAAAAKQGMQATMQMVAVHGRAATRGEASRTLQDPGATVGMLLFDALQKIVP